MDESNPYQPPEKPPTMLEGRRRRGLPWDFWRSMLALLIGVGLIGFSLFTYLTAAMIPVWALGGGIGMLMVAGLGLFYYFGD